MTNVTYAELNTQLLNSEKYTIVQTADIISKVSTIDEAKEAYGIGRFKTRYWSTTTWPKKTPIVHSTDKRIAKLSEMNTKEAFEMIKILFPLSSDSTIRYGIFDEENKRFYFTKEEKTRMEKARKMLKK